MQRALLLLCTLVACAPSQQRLLAQRQYFEALAGVQEGALDGGPVLATIAADLQVGVHLEAIPVDAVRARLPGAAAGLDELAVVRAIHTANALPVPALDVDFALLRGGLPLAAIDTSSGALALRTGEPVPRARVIEYPAGSNLKLVATRVPLLGIFARVMFNVVTVGTMHSVVPVVRTEQHGAYTQVILPIESDYARVSPLAHTLHTWLGADTCETTGECRRHVLWPRISGPLELAVIVRVRTIDPQVIVYRIPLPAGTLDEALRATFGGRERSLEQLARETHVRPLVSYRLDVLDFNAKTRALSNASRRRLCRLVRGTARQPGLLGRPELRMTLEIKDPDADDERCALQGREALLRCGVAASQIDLDDRGPGDFVLRARHGVDPVTPPP